MLNDQCLILINVRSAFLLFTAAQCTWRTRVRRKDVPMKNECLDTDFLINSNPGTPKNIIRY